MLGEYNGGYVGIEGKYKGDTNSGNDKKMQKKCKGNLHEISQKLGTH